MAWALWSSVNGRLADDVSRLQMDEQMRRLLSATQNMDRDARYEMRIQPWLVYSKERLLSLAGRESRPLLLVDLSRVLSVEPKF
jgi:hypothetical protein